MKKILIKSSQDMSALNECLYLDDDLNNEIESTVKDIIKTVITEGDKAVRAFTKKFDGAALDHLWVSKDEFKEADTLVPNAFKEIIETAKNNIWEFHEKQLPAEWTIEKPGIQLGQLIRPMEKVAVYVPGGKASYPSSVLMNIIPALIAGVNSITVVTPPNKDGKVNPYVLFSAKALGVETVLKVGGAQGIAAVAYGTESIPSVDKIVGPGNAYVATAKKLVFGKVDIDMIAGPSEICILADGAANPAYIAADLLSQAEHDEMARVYLVTTSEAVADTTIAELNIQAAALPRQEIINSAIENNAYIITVPDIKTGLDVCNKIAPEHLELMIENPKDSLPKIYNAGSIFLGNYSPEPLGDYYAGTNHTLPTSGTARYASPLGVYDFIKRPSFIYYQEEALRKDKDAIAYFAETEGLYAHANSIRIRFRNEVK